MNMMKEKISLYEITRRPPHVSRLLFVKTCELNKILKRYERKADREGLWKET